MKPELNQFKIVADAGMEPGADLGPVVTREAKQRIEGLITMGEEEGAKVVLDGRGLVVPGYENGNFIGPTVIHEVKVGSSCLFYATVSLRIRVLDYKLFLTYYLTATTTITILWLWILSGTTRVSRLPER